MPLQTLKKPKHITPSLLNPPNRNPIVRCPTCGNSWLEEVRLQQYQETHSVIVGQRVPVDSSVEHIVLRCPGCSQIVLPTISNISGKLGKSYEGMVSEVSSVAGGIDELEGPTLPNPFENV